MISQALLSSLFNTQQLLYSNTVENEQAGQPSVHDNVLVNQFLD